MRKKNNPHQGSIPDPSSPSTAKVDHYLFDFSFPEELIKASAIAPPAAQKPVAVEMPGLPDSLFANLPDFLKKVVDKSSIKQERDMLLFGTLVTLSACLHKIHGIYDSHIVYPNLYLYVTAPSSAATGPLSLCKRLVLPVHQAIMEEGKVMTQQQKMGRRKNKKFPERGLFLPTSNNQLGVLRQLAANDGHGLLFETQGELMAKAIKTQFRTFNDGFRKGFHHESISYFRLMGNEFVEMDEPCISILLAGNFKLLSSLVPYSSLGLFSRFMFFFINDGPQWEDVFPAEGDPEMEKHFDELGQEFLIIYEALNKQTGLVFNYTKDQQKEFNYFFSLLHDKYGILQGDGLVATIRRLGLIAFRISMILSALRMFETGDFSPEKKCQDEDFQASLSMVRVLFRHASYAFSKLPYE